MADPDEDGGINWTLSLRLNRILLNRGTVERSFCPEWLFIIIPHTYLGQQLHKRFD